MSISARLGAACELSAAFCNTISVKYSDVILMGIDVEIYRLDPVQKAVSPSLLMHCCEKKIKTGKIFLIYKKLQLVLN